MVDVLNVLKKNELSDADWMTLGLQLGLKMPLLKTIENDQKKAGACMRECIVAWLEMKNNVKKQGIPSWHTLVKAIKHIDASIAERIKQGIHALN